MQGRPDRAPFAFCGGGKKRWSDAGLRRQPIGEGLLTI
jgi:hypothetical protein